MTKTLMAMTAILTLHSATDAYAKPGGGTELALEQGRKAGPAAVTKLTGMKARRLTRAIKLAGVKPVKQRGAWTFKLPALACTSISETEDLLGHTMCDVGKDSVDGARAALLFDAMAEADIPAEDGMSKTRMTVVSLTCTDSPEVAGGIDAMHVCSFKAM